MNSDQMDALLKQAGRDDREGRRQAALAACDQVLQVDPENRRAGLLKGSILVNLHGAEDEANSKKAAEIARSLMQRHDDEEVRILLVGALLQIGLRYHDRNAIDDSIPLFAEAATLRPDYGYTYFLLANAYIQKGRWDDALAAALTAVGLAPEFADGYLALGIAYLQKSHVHEAIAALSKAAAMKPDDASAHTYLGVAYGEKGDIGNALKEGKRALELEPNNPAATEVVTISERIAKEQLAQPAKKKRWFGLFG